MRDTERYGPDMSDQERIKVGLHVQQVEGLRPGRIRQTVLRGAQLAGLDHYLARAPLASVQVFGELRDDAGAFTGDHRRGQIRLSAQRSRGEGYGVPYEWGNVATVATVASSRELSLQRTFVHELGHYLLYQLMERQGRDAVEALINPAFRAALHSGKLVSDRAAQNWREYFCETFSASVYLRQELMSRDRAGYRLVEQVRSLLEVDS